MGRLAGLIAYVKVGHVHFRISDHTYGEPVPRTTENSGEWVPVSLDLIKSKNIALAILTVVLVVLGAIPFLIWSSPWWLLIPAAICVLALISWPLNYFEVRNTAYQLRTDEVLVRTGALSRTTTALPYGRIQRVDLNEGPIDAKYGLAALTLESAAENGSVTIPGLLIDNAKDIRDAILRDSEVRRIGL